MPWPFTGLESASDPLPSHEACLAKMEQAERDEGWLTWCDRRSIFVALNREFVTALAAAIGDAQPLVPVLEIAAGRGQLAQALSQARVNVTPTDGESAPALKRF